MEKEEVLIELNKYTKLVSKFIKKDKIDFVSFLDYETEVDNYTKKIST